MWSIPSCYSAVLHPRAPMSQSSPMEKRFRDLTHPRFRMLGIFFVLLVLKHMWAGANPVQLEWCWVLSPTGSAPAQGAQPWGQQPLPQLLP